MATTAWTTASTLASAFTSEPDHGVPGRDPEAPRLISARIAAIRRETPRVSVFWLDYGDAEYRFRPGQWLDLYANVSGRREVGGYSITSTHSEPGRIRIAVRHSDHHPVTRWLTQVAAVGDAVEISEGQGDFHCAPAHGRRLVLLGAGIGITPLVGILREVYECHPDVSVTLLYSARNEGELLFRAELDAMAAERANICCLYLAGPVAGEPAPQGGPRMLVQLERAGLLDPTATYFFCGPRGFVEDLATGLAAHGISAERLVYERWW